MAKSALSSKKSKAVAPSAAPTAPPKPAAASSESDASSEGTSDASESEAEAAAAVGVKELAGTSARRTGYTPPEGFKLAQVSVDKSEFDWDSINRDPNVQLWAIKVPKGFKAKYLESMSITIPNDVGKASSSLPSHAVGFLSRKGSEFDAFVVADLEAERAALKKKAKDAKGKGKRTKEEADDEDGPAEDTNHGGHEIRSLVPLLPKHSHANKLFVAPRPISLALNLTLRPPPSVLPNASALSSLIASQPDPVPGSILSAADLLDPVAIQAKKRVRTQPPGLRMRLQLPGTRADVANVPSGAAQPAAKAPVAVDAMEVDEPVAVAPPVVGAKEKRSKEEKAERKAKKEAKKAKKESD